MDKNAAKPSKAKQGQAEPSKAKQSQASAPTKKSGVPAKIDRRVLRTRKSINEAFDKLISEMDVSKITVSAIAREANIDRKTFYLHFSSIDSLISSRAEESLEHVIDIIRSHDDGVRKQRIHNILTDVNKLIIEDMSFFEHIAHSITVDSLIHLIEGSARPAMTAKGLDARLMDDLEFRMRMIFYLSGTFKLYRSWILSDRSTPIERISKLLEETLDSDSFPVLAIAPLEEA